MSERFSYEQFIESENARLLPLNERKRVSFASACARRFMRRKRGNEKEDMREEEGKGGGGGERENERERRRERKKERKRDSLYLDSLTRL